MNVSLLEKPRTIKVSSKRQITIPAKIYEDAGFEDYALCTWTDKGLLIQPLSKEDSSDDLTVSILQHLVDSGLEGDELIAEYKTIKDKIDVMMRKLDEAEEDIIEGRVGSADEMMQRMRARYGLHRN